MNGPIYLDYNATTPVDPAVVEAMVPYLFERFGNASSSHAYGREAHDALDRARSQLSNLIGSRPDEIVFTGGGSESDNLAIKGAVFAGLDRRPHVITTAVEHPAVLNTVRYLQRRFGVDATFLPVDQYGLLQPEQVANALRPETVLVSIMHANNEVGTLQPIAEISARTRDAGVLLHVDTAQAVGKIPIDVDALGVDLLTVAGHKLYAPKGIGALYVRRGTQLEPLVHGSGQEHGLRAGTENISSIVALGMAAEIAGRELAAGKAHQLSHLRKRLHGLLEERIPGVMLNGHPTRRLPNTLNVSLPGVIGQDVLSHAPEVAASTGAACHSGLVEPSAVLLAMGLSPERALGALRLSLGRWSTEQEVVQAGDALARAYSEVAAAAPATPF